MKLEQSFTVAAPIGQVWEALIDVERVAPCLPGADITGQAPDGAYQGTFTVKLGPTTAAYRGALRMESLDAETLVSKMSARGTDIRGQGGASASIVSTVTEEREGTRVDVATDFTITGRLARFGRSGMIEDISKRLMRDFAGCLQQRLAAERATQEAPLPGAGAADVADDDAAQADAALASAGGAAAEATSAGGPPPGAPAQAPSGGPAAPLPGAEPPTSPPPAEQPPSPPQAEQPAGEPAKPSLGERIRRLFGRGS
jgi:uncharacterized protein